MDNENYEIIKLNKKEMKMMYYSSPYYKTHQNFKYLSENDFDTFFYPKEKKKFETTFVCIIEKNINEKELLKGQKDLKSYNNAFVGTQMLKHEPEDIDIEKMKNIIDRKIVGLTKYAYSQEQDKITRVFASLNPNYIGKGLSKFFNKIDYDLIKDFLLNTEHPKPYVNTDNDFSANAFFTTKEKILQTRKRIFKEFPKVHEYLKKYYMFPHNIDEEINKVQNVKKYFKDMSFYGSKYHYGLIKLVGMKPLIHEEKQEDLIIKNFQNQKKNIYFTIKNIIEKTGKDKFTFVYSFVSNDKNEIYKEKYIFNDMSKKELRYAIYFVEYDKNNGITILNDDYECKKSSIQSNTLEKTIKLYDYNERKFYNMNKENIINRFSILFSLKSNYLNKRHHYGNIENSNEEKIDYLDKLKKEYEEYEKIFETNNKNCLELN